MNGIINGFLIGFVIGQVLYHLMQLGIFIVKKIFEFVFDLFRYSFLGMHGLIRLVKRLCVRV